jgi:transcription elongation factor GreB
MRKEIPDESDKDDEPDIFSGTLKNYVTPLGFSAMQDELRALLSDERPKIV